MGLETIDDKNQAHKEFPTQLIGSPVDGVDEYEKRLRGYYCIRNFLTETNQGEGIFDERRRLAEEYPNCEFVVHLYKGADADFRRIWAKKSC